MYALATLWIGLRACDLWLGVKADEREGLASELVLWLLFEPGTKGVSKS